MHTHIKSHYAALLSPLGSLLCSLPRLLLTLLASGKLGAALRHQLGHLPLVLRPRRVAQRRILCARGVLRLGLLVSAHLLTRSLLFGLRPARSRLRQPAGPAELLRLQRRHPDTHGMVDSDCSTDTLTYTAWQTQTAAQTP